MDLEEFSFTFDHGLQSFLKNKTKIDSYLRLEGDYWNKRKKAEHAEKVYYGRRKIKEAGQETLSKLIRLKERTPVFLNFGALNIDRIDNELEKEGVLQLPAVMEEDIRSLEELAKHVDDRAETCFAS